MGMVETLNALAPLGVGSLILGVLTILLLRRPRVRADVHVTEQRADDDTRKLEAQLRLEERRALAAEWEQRWNGVQAEMEHVRKVATEEAADLRTELRKQRDYYEAKLQEVRDELEGFSRRYYSLIQEYTVVQGDKDALQRRVGELETHLAEARAEITELQERLARYEAVNGSGRDHA